MRFKATLPPEQLRAMMAQRVNDHRDRLLSADLSFEGHSYQVDDESLLDMRDTIDDMTAGDSTAWRTAANQMVMMNLATLRRLRKAAVARKRAIKLSAMSKKDEVLAAADPSTVDINAGWPAGGA